MIVKLTFSYLGTNFKGSAENVGVRTVVAEIRKVIQKLLGCDLRLDLAGRTDSGVHARCQVISFEIPKEYAYKRFRVKSKKAFSDTFIYKVNRFLPHDITLSDVSIVDDNFSARFSAKKRTYKYFLLAGENLPAYYDLNYWLINNALNVSAVKKASKMLVGSHDFETFSKPALGRGTVRDVFATAFESNDFEGYTKYTFTIVGNAFCWQMVRGIVGSLFEVGSGKMDLKYFEDMLTDPFRQKIRTIAPPQGLYLWDIKY